MYLQYFNSTIGLLSYFDCQVLWDEIATHANSAHLLLYQMTLQLCIYLENMRVVNKMKNIYKRIKGCFNGEKFISLPCMSRSALRTFL